MLTRDQLAAILLEANVEDVSRLSGVSTKTIYRLRNRQHAPTLDTVVSLLDAVEKLNRRPAKEAA